MLGRWLSLLVCAVVVVISLDHRSLHVGRLLLLQDCSVSVVHGMGAELELLCGRSPHSVVPVLSIRVLVCCPGVLSRG